MVKEYCQMVSQKPKYCKNFERNSHWRKLSMIMVWERYCNASPKPELFLFLFVYIFIHISANMSLFGLKFSQMILHTETSKLMYNWSFLFVVLHKPTLLPSTFNMTRCYEEEKVHMRHISDVLALTEHLGITDWNVLTREFQWEFIQSSSFWDSHPKGGKDIIRTGRNARSHTWADLDLWVW